MAGAGQHKGQWPLKWKGQAEAEHRGPRTRSRFYSEHNWVPLKDWKQERDVIFLKIKRNQLLPLKTDWSEAAEAGKPVRKILYISR